MPPAAQLSDEPSLSAAYEACEGLARKHYENFPVASRLLPRDMRPHVAAVYAFARVADDMADEGDRQPEERQRLLDGWLDRLHNATGASPAPAPGDRDTDGVFVALGNTIRERSLPISLFEDLLSAFRQDTWKTRYETFDEVLDYCRRSANPVGRLVLRIAGYDGARIERASDCVCTALQLANFWQDLERDWRRGRLYVPLDELRAAGAHEGDLDRRELSVAWRAVLQSLADRTRDLFMRGREVADLVHGRLRLELRLTWLGGMRILERRRFDVFDARPALGARDGPVLLWRALTWRRAGNSERSEPRERSGELRGPASERVRGAGGAKPPGKE